MVENDKCNDVKIVRGRRLMEAPSLVLPIKKALIEEKK
jgi:hypothetical protein